MFGIEIPTLHNLSDYQSSSPFFLDPIQISDHLGIWQLSTIWIPDKSSIQIPTVLLKFDWKMQNPTICKACLVLLECKTLEETVKKILKKDRKNCAWRWITTQWDESDGPAVLNRRHVVTRLDKLRLWTSHWFSNRGFTLCSASHTRRTSIQVVVVVVVVHQRVQAVILASGKPDEGYTFVHKSFR